MAVAKIAVFVVGHRDWGKSTTLKALTGGDGRRKQWKIAGRWFTLKRRSNDDPPKPPYESTLQFLQRPNFDDALIVSLAPDFKNKESETQAILDTLKSKGYVLHFFVIKNQQSKLGAPPISDEEMTILQFQGMGMTMDGYDTPENIAKALHRYIRAVLS